MFKYNLAVFIKLLSLLVLLTPLLFSQENNNDSTLKTSQIYERIMFIEVRGSQRIESDTIKSDVYKEIMNEMDIIIGNDLEFNVADNSTNGLELAKVYIKKKPSVIVYKMGEEGSKVFTKENESQYGTFNVEAIKPTGAGDAFNGGFISSLYNGLSLEDAVIRGSANAAIVVTRVGCSSAMPNNQELEKFINQNQKEL